jgi:catechol 2,3-dioxygenase
MTLSSPPSAPPQLGTVTLSTADLSRLQAFYERVLGLETLAEATTQVTLGAAGTPLLRLQAGPDLPRAPVSRPGLYHTAFLLPTRADLGRWLAHAAGLGLSLGSGDHLVSEAFYLSDPDGNGIEVYADRPRATWTYQDGQVQMATLAVDVGAVLGSAGITARALERGAPPYAGAPAGTRVGHVHLKVGDARAAARFYRETLGLEVMADLGSAVFLSWGGYHHHLGLNEWHTRGQGRPETPAAGLAGVEVRTPDLAGLRERLARRGGDTVDGGDSLTLHDPWGNRVTVRPGA